MEYIPRRETILFIHYDYTILQKLLNFKLFSDCAMFFVNYVNTYVNTIMSTADTAFTGSVYHF